VHFVAGVRAVENLDGKRRLTGTRGIEDVGDLDRLTLSTPAADFFALPSIASD
jgi:hypothetical protein